MEGDERGRKTSCEMKGLRGFGGEQREHSRGMHAAQLLCCASQYGSRRSSKRSAGCAVQPWVSEPRN